MTRVRRGDLGFFLLAALLTSGCGGGGSASTEPQSSMPASPPAPPEAPPAQPPPAPPAPPPAPNREPIVANPNPNPRGIGGHLFSYDFTQGGTTFVDPDGDPLSYDVQIRCSHRPDSGLLNVVGTTITGNLPTDGWCDVHIEARDGSGRSTPHSFTIIVDPNSLPLVANPNLGVMTTPGAHINYDPTQGGTTFTDPDGDVLSYEVTVLSSPEGLSVQGLHIVGVLDAVGLVVFEITAYDGYGGSGTDRFAVAIAAPEPGEPALPGRSYVYADEEVPLPWRFEQSSGFDLGPFWNVTPLDNPVTNAGATLGRVLFYDKRLSLTNTHACASCHEQAKGFAAPERFSTGVLGLPTTRNAMSLANVRYNFDERWFSDLRAESLEVLAGMPIEDPTELGNFLPMLAEKLAATSFYPPLFEAAFGTPDVTPDRLTKAIAQFLRSMITYRSKFDLAYMRMELADPEPVPSAVLTAEELRGAEVFNQSLCRHCHTQEVQTLLRAANNGLDSVITDPGVGSGQFRAASLRNIAVTGPYMHDGRFDTLREVIDHYDHGVQDSPTLSSLLRDREDAPRRLNLSEEDKDALEAFLRTLTDEEFLHDPKFSDPFM